MKARYVGRGYRTFFGVEPYTVHEGVHGYYIEDIDGDSYYFYRNGKLVQDWEWVQDNTAWMRKDKKVVLIRDMIDSHLLNLIPFIMNGGGYDSYISVRLGEAIFREVENRRLNVRVSKEDFISVCEQREDMFKLGLSALQEEIMGGC